MGRTLDNWINVKFLEYFNICGYVEEDTTGLSPVHSGLTLEEGVQ